MVTKEDVQAKLEAVLGGEVTVRDISGGCGTSFEVEVVSPAFAGKPLLARHRMVNDALKDSMPDIHALSIKKAAPPAAQ